MNEWKMIKIEWQKQTINKVKNQLTTTIKYETCEHILIQIQDSNLYLIWFSSVTSLFLYYI